MHTPGRRRGSKAFPRNKLIPMPIPGTKCLCFLVIVSQGAGYAQGLQPPPKQHPLKTFSRTVGGDVLHVFSSPLRFRQKHSLPLLAFAATTTVFMAVLDRQIDEDFVERDDLHVKPAIGLAKIGDGFDKISSRYVLAGLTLPMLAGGLVFRDKKLLETTQLMMESFLIAGAITWTGKRVFGRARPFTGEGPHEFQVFKFNVKRERRSFPSGHATSAFSMMTVLAKQYHVWWIEIPAYTVAVSVALQRLDSREHWGADVVAGSVIGYWVGSTLVSRRQSQSNRASINPYILGNRVAFVVSF